MQVVHAHRRWFLPLAAALLFAADGFALTAEDYPIAMEVVLGHVRAEVAARREGVISAPSSGLLELFVEPRSQELDKGVRVAELDREGREIEAQLLATERRLLETRERTDWESQRLDRVQRTESQLSQARSELAFLRRLKENPKQAGAFNLVDRASNPEEDDPGALMDSLIKRAKDRIDALEDHLRNLRDPELGKLAWEEQKLRLRQKELALKARRRRSELVMPFTGELTLLVPVSGDERVFPVDAGQDLFRIRDLTEIFAHVPLENTRWRFLERSRLRVIVGQGRNAVPGMYHHDRVRTLNGKDVKVYSFLLPPGSRAARAYIGGTVTGTLRMVLKAPARLVPKLDIIRAAPDGFRSGGYEGAVAAAFPGYELVVAGEESVAIRVNHE